jgi:hypothetical protein
MSGPICEVPFDHLTLRPSETEEMPTWAILASPCDGAPKKIASGVASPETAAHLRQIADLIEAACSA